MASLSSPMVTVEVSKRTRFTGFSAHAAPPAASMRQEHSVDLFNIRFSPPVVIRPDCSWRRTLEIAGRNHFSELEWDVEFACQDAAGEAVPALWPRSLERLIDTQVFIYARNPQSKRYIYIHLESSLSKMDGDQKTKNKKTIIPDITFVANSANIQKYVPAFLEQGATTESAVNVLEKGKAKWDVFCQKLGLKPGHAARLRRALLTVMEAVKKEKERIEAAKAPIGYGILASVGYFGKSFGSCGTALKIASKKKSIELVFHPGYRPVSGAFRINNLSGHTHNRSMGFVPAPDCYHVFDIKINKSGENEVKICDEKSKRTFVHKFKCQDLYDPTKPPVVSWGHEFNDGKPLELGKESMKSKYGLHKIKLSKIDKIQKKEKIEAAEAPIGSAT
eukprot:jgi/Bigna1/84275/fgenesh1_pg.128_\